MRGISKTVAAVGLAWAMAGCGGPARTSEGGTTSAASARGSAGGEADEQGALPLDPAREVAGTGVTLRAPRGSEPTPFGAGFVHRARRIQMLVAAAHGGAEVIEAFRRGIETNAEEVSTEEVEVDGRSTTLHVDRQASGELELERVWVLIREGERAFVVAGAYDATRSERVRDLVRASVLSARWSPTEALDPEAAVGFRLEAPEGLVLDRSTTGSVTYGREGQMVPPVIGSPTLFLIAVPVQVPEAQRDEACEPILAQVGPVPDEQVRSRERIETERIEGCEVTGWQENETDDGETMRLATYAAVLYLGEDTFLVAGVAREDEAETWLPRFAQAARTVSSAR
jgi:hypothetical protein